MSMEFCRGLLKVMKFSIAKNYLNGSDSLMLAINKPENIVILVAIDYFFPTSSLSSVEVSQFCCIFITVVMRATYTYLALNL